MSFDNGSNITENTGINNVAENTGINNISDLFYAVLFIIGIVLLYSMSGGKYNNNGKSITYYIKPSNLDSTFHKQASAIIKNSTIKQTHDILEVYNQDCDIFIELVPRNELSRFYTDKDDIEFYPGTKDRIWFSFTTQNPKPRIYIDGTNWLEGVKQSGLTLLQYRQYVILHEFMHGLGYDHQKCNKDTAVNGMCPVLYQSTRGCPDGFKCGYTVTMSDYADKINGSYFK